MKTDLNDIYMKVLQSYMFRAICAIATGVLLISNPDSTVKGITMAIGIMFLISGAISCATYFNAKTHGTDEIYDAEGKLIARDRPVFPIVGLGSVLLGFILALMPGLFITSLMYVLGAIIILGAINQYMTLANARRIMRVPVWFWLCPSVVLLAGLLVIVKPMETAAMPLLIIGWCLLFYGVTEIINSIKIHRERKRIENR